MPALLVKKNFRRPDRNGASVRAADGPLGRRSATAQPAADRDRCDPRRRRL